MLHPDVLMAKLADLRAALADPNGWEDAVNLATELGMKLNPEGVLIRRDPAEIAAEMPGGADAVPEVDLIDIGDMELPEAEPVDGWICTIPFDREVIEWRKNFHGQMGWDLTPDARDWCDANMRHPFYVLGDSAIDQPFARERHIEVYFTDEHDYIHFKMMYG